MCIVSNTNKTEMEMGFSKYYIYWLRISVSKIFMISYDLQWKHRIYGKFKKKNKISEMNNINEDSCVCHFKISNFQGTIHIIHMMNKEE